MQEDKDSTGEEDNDVQEVAMESGAEVVRDLATEGGATSTDVEHGSDVENASKGGADATEGE